MLNSSVALAWRVICEPLKDMKIKREAGQWWGAMDSKLRTWP